MNQTIYRSHPDAIQVLLHIENSIKNREFPFANQAKQSGITIEFNGPDNLYYQDACQGFWKFSRAEISIIQNAIENQIPVIFTGCIEGKTVCSYLVKSILSQVNFYPYELLGHGRRRDPRYSFEFECEIQMPFESDIRFSQLGYILNHGDVMIPISIA